ncbi:hypothetical protein Pmani_017411 [Petrolisthes manimaculis]|uniref:Uncharacterized protein n=1 Tax=Petrolisthes manimaculis TaxID=1843537 RepID=A0AAE1PPS4_9EUCA|nr:hypothetical protein Pmani_017411 [Petrolisthes manimaculis]
MYSTGDGVFTLLCSVVGTSDGRVPPSKYPPSLMLSVVPSHWTVSLVCSEVLIKTEVLVAGGRVRTDRWQSGSSLPSLHAFPPPQNLASVTHHPVLFHQAVRELVVGDTLAAVTSKLSVRVGTHCKTHMETGVRELVVGDTLAAVTSKLSVRVGTHCKTHMETGVRELVVGDTLAAVTSKLSVRVGTHCKTHMETGVRELVVGDTLAAVTSKLSVRVGTHCKTHMETGITELFPDPLSVVDADVSCFQGIQDRLVDQG